MKFVVVLCIFIIVLSIMLFFEGWFSHKSQVKKNQYMSEQNMYGKASFDKFRKEFDSVLWTHDKEFKWSLFYYKENSYECISEIHADIFMFNHIGMIMKTPIDYWKAIRYAHKYIKTHFADDLKRKNTKLYKWE